MSTFDRFLKSARSTVLGPQRIPGRGRSGNLLDDATLFEAQDRAAEAQRIAVSSAQSMGATAQEQRAAVDAVADRTTSLISYGGDIRTAAVQVKESLERVKLVALNATLEGARQGDPAGTPLAVIGEEVRALVVKALEAFDEHAELLSKAERERESLRGETQEVQRATSKLADEMLQAQAAQRTAQQRVDTMGEELRRATGTDPEVAKHAAEAAEHARGLLAALSALNVKKQGSVATRALWPTIEPLLRVIRDLGPRSEEGGSR